METPTFYVSHTLFSKIKNAEIRVLVLDDGVEYKPGTIALVRLANPSTSFEKASCRHIRIGGRIYATDSFLPDIYNVFDISYL